MASNLQLRFMFSILFLFLKIVNHSSMSDGIFTKLGLCEYYMEGIGIFSLFNTFAIELSQTAFLIC